MCKDYCVILNQREFLFSLDLHRLILEERIFREHLNFMQLLLLYIIHI